MKKIIVLGPPLTGKTTLANYLKSKTAIPVLDFDDELLKLNNGKYPANYPVLNEKLKAQVIKDVLQKNEVIFFAFEISFVDLRVMKRKRFTIVQLTADIEVLRTRNLARLVEQPENDAFQYVEKNMSYQKEIFELGLIDEVVDTTQSIEDISTFLLYL
jgi:dephospho-CoA kinase